MARSLYTKLLKRFGASAGFWGYMEGALRSGMLAAERIHQAIMETALAKVD